MATTTYGTDEIAQHVVTTDPNNTSANFERTQELGHDAYGRVRQVSDDAGELLQAFVYTAYGKPLSIHDGH